MNLKPGVKQQKIDGWQNGKTKNGDMARGSEFERNRLRWG